MGAKFTERHLSFEVFPFSYPEYLSFTGKDPGVGSFHAFLEDGGFPVFLEARRDLILQEPSNVSHWLYENRNRTSQFTGRSSLVPEIILLTSTTLILREFN
ncbi:MAG: hypothetical protein WA151_23140 [Desulfatirhabdiaceae bacterium]